MAVTVASKTSGLSFSNGYATASVSWTAGTRGIVFVASARTGGADNSPAHTVTGGSVTWVHKGDRSFASRRCISMFVSDGTPATGALTITYSQTGTFNGSIYAVGEIAGFDSANVHDAVQTAENTTGTSPLNLPDLGTIDTDDLAIFGVAIDDDSNVLTVSAGSTLLVRPSTGGSVRQIVVGYSSTDDTPGATWTVATGGGAIGAIFNTTAGGGGATAARHFMHYQKLRRAA